MQIRYPEYYRHFHCLAGACPDSCCKEWTVDVDPEAAARYRALDSELGERLRQVLKDEDVNTVMEIVDGRCPMWREDGLCRIHAELGHDALCQTCRDYPRLTHDYGCFLEQDLELSCPAAAKLILAGSHATIFQTVDGGDLPDYDEEQMAILLSSRDEVTRFLQSTAYPLPHALAIVLCYAHSVQSFLDGGEPVRLEPEACLQDIIKFAGTPDWDALFSLFKGLEILTPQWKQRLEKGFIGSQWQPAHMQLFSYFLRRYWLQTVSDGDLVCRVTFAIAGCLMVYALGGDLVQTAQLFSKEIENDPDNVDALLDACYTHPALTDTNLLGILLSTLAKA